MDEPRPVNLFPDETHTALAATRGTPAMRVGGACVVEWVTVGFAKPPGVGAKGVRPRAAGCQPLLPNPGTDQASPLLRLPSFAVRPSSFCGLRFSSPFFPLRIDIPRHRTGIQRAAYPSSDTNRLVQSDPDYAPQHLLTSSREPHPRASPAGAPPLLLRAKSPHRRPRATSC